MPIIGLAITVLLLATGAAFDTARAQLVQTRLSKALDAAGLAAGTTLSTTDLSTEVTKYMNANFNSYMGATITNLSAVANSDGSLITLSATATLPTTLMRITGTETLTISASSEITRASSGLEVVLVLDNTGSMDGSRLTSLKTAATTLVNTLFGDDEVATNLWVGLVPFSQAVNIGTSHSAWLDGTSFKWGPTSWEGCVDARYSSLDVTDTAPTGNLFRAYYWPDDSKNDWIRNNGNYRSITSERGPNRYCPQPMTPMTATKQTAIDAIDDIVAIGYTHVNLVAVWGRRMLSPNWRGYWGGEMDTNSLPLDYNTPKMSKAVIIMTDGENTMHSDYRTAYGYLSEGRLGSTWSTSTAASTLNSKLTTVCTSMKNNNIIVYTIAFGNPGSSIESLMQSCASQSDYYFDSPTSTELQAAFQTIGDSLSNLRVSH